MQCCLIHVLDCSMSLVDWFLCRCEMCIDGLVGKDGMWTVMWGLLWSDGKWNDFNVRIIEGGGICKLWIRLCSIFGTSQLSIVMKTLLYLEFYM